MGYRERLNLFCARVQAIASGRDILPFGFVDELRYTYVEWREFLKDINIIL